MEQLSNEAAFASLFEAVCQQGLGQTLHDPLSEADSKLLAVVILEQTGLVVGSKSLKNYALYLLHRPESKRENPSVATLDTLARFVLRAPRTDEVRRKTHEGHYPYWFQYRSSLAASALPIAAAEPVPAAIATPAAALKNWRGTRRERLLLAAFLAITSLAAGLSWWLIRVPRPADFYDSFTSVAADSLRGRGWSVQQLDTAWWARRAARPGTCALYTLPGDSWPAGPRPAGIRNLLVRRIGPDCFSAEMHLDQFFPVHNWQQAGILLSENKDFTGKLLRLSLSYNDYFGGYARPAEIIVQGISSTEAASRSKPEEFAHVPLFALRYPHDSLVAANLRQSALKIEKKGHRFRFLYATGSMESFAFTEAATGTFAIEPRYLALFATQGFAPASYVAPAYLTSFSLVKWPCED
ncbi:MAG: hypothetical protein ACRYG7_09855 [Janthinobacterium lividum]